MKQLLAAGTAIALVVVAVYALLIDNPLRPGHVAAPDPRTWDAELSAESEDAYVYHYVPGADYYALTTIRNDGLLPVTITAPTPEESDRPGPNTVQYLVAGQVGPDGAVDLAEVSASPHLESTSLPPGGELAIWLHWQMGQCRDGRPRYSLGSGATIVQALVNWSILGVPRTNWVPLVKNVEVRNVDEDPHDTCAGQAAS